MASSDETRHGLAVCDACEAVQPVVIRPGEGLRALGNPNCRCGKNEFRLLDGETAE